MSDVQKQAIQAIEAQQAKVRERSYQWLVGEQLKDICRAEPHSAELIAQDLQVKGMGLVEAEKKIEGLARENGGRVTGIEADRILREFYGLPSPGEDFSPAVSQTPGAPPGGVIDPLDFL